jgi:mannosylglycoprotein endo-beta-mannosidase
MFLNCIQELDATSDNQGLNEEGWALRYHLEDQLTSILSTEEEYWRQRGRQQWVLKGDANTKYFHAMANGRRQNCAIVALNSTSGLVTDKEAIQEMIYSFYLDLMGAEEPKLLSLDSDIWPLQSRVIDLENEVMLRAFSMEELEAVLRDTKSDTAPGPNNFPILFYKQFWPLLKDLVLQIPNGFALGRVDISRLNFGILSLTPRWLGLQTSSSSDP